MKKGQLICSVVGISVFGISITVTTSIIAHNLVNKSHHNDKKEILKLKKGDDSSNEYLYVKVCEITYVHDTDSEIDIYLVGDREIKSTGDGHNHYQQGKTECQLAGLLI